jgi:hypothetical protein
VVKAGPEGLLLQLWGKMRGWVPRSQFSTETIDCLEKMFFLGQAVKCRVVEAEEARDQPSCSVSITSRSAGGKRAASGSSSVLREGAGGDGRARGGAMPRHHPQPRPD